MAAGAIATLAAGPFVPPWAALLIGAVAGLLVPLATYVVDYVLRLDDPTAVIVTHGLGAAWGLLAVALFADGLAGRGWNGIGLDRYLGVAGQGVTGLLAAVQMQPDWPGQIQAQIIGLAAVVLIPFFAATVGFAAIAALDQVWQVTHAPSLTLEPETMPVADPFFEAMGDEATSNK
jgi:Amt family ammonium transporter